MVFEVVFFTLLHFDSSGSTREKGRPTHAYHCYQPRKPPHVPRWFHQDLVVQHTAIVCSEERAIAVFL
jgi:hypothetical protein